MLVVGAIDRRVRCVVAQVPVISGHRQARRHIRADFISLVQAQFDEDRRHRFAGQPPAMIPVVAEDPLAPSASPTRDAFQWFTETARTRAPAWRNEVTLRSVEMFMEYEPGVYIGWVSPTPLLVVVARDDHLTVTDEALTAYNQALEPKKLVLIPGGHFDAYGAGFAVTSAAARDWFVDHLQAKKP
ncbi:MAG: alpha/beta hydrolase [Minicystis sp.]